MQVQTVIKKNDVDFYNVSYEETLNLDFNIPAYSNKNVIVNMKPSSVVNINVNLAVTSALLIYIQKDAGGTITVNETSIDTSAYIIQVLGDRQIIQYRQERIQA